MNIKLINNQEFTIEKTQFEGSVLQIYFTNNTCEQISSVFSNKLNIDVIKVIDNSNDVISILNGYVVQITTELKGGKVIVSLRKEADNTVERVNDLEINDNSLQSQIDEIVTEVIPAIIGI